METQVGLKPENMKITGRIHIVHRDKDGNLLREQTINNLVVTAGKNFLATWLAATSQSEAFMKYMGLGTGTTAAALADTGLQTPLATRVTGTVTSSTNILQIVAVFGSGVNTGAVTEAALFSASSGGTMFARQVFAAYNKTSTDSLTFTWQITFS